MDIGFLTRFFRFAPGTLVNRLTDEAKLRGHHVHLVRPQDVKLREDSKTGEPKVQYLNQPWVKMDLLIPLLRWDDSYGHILMDEIGALGQHVLVPSVLPQGDRVAMTKVFAKYALQTPPTFIMDRAKVWKQRETLPWPMYVRARLNHDRRLVRKVRDWAGLDTCLHECEAVLEEPLYLLGIDALEGEYVSVLVIADKVEGAFIRMDGVPETKPTSQLVHAGFDRLEATSLSLPEIQAVTAARKMYGVMIASVDFVRSKQGPLIVEVNMAPNLSVYEKMSAKNLARPMIDLLEFVVRHKE